LGIILNATVTKKINSTQKKQIAERNKIIVLFRAGISRAEIGAFVGRHISTIHRWIQRIRFGDVLCDRPRKGRPPIFSPLIQLKITAFFCQSNPLPGCNTMTLKWASNYFNQNSSFLGCTISISSIRRILKKHSLRPHLHKYFLQITDPNFFEIMPLLVNLYLDPPKYLFSFDECPGIQALRKVAPPLPPGKGEAGGKYSEPNYSRNGTKDLYAFFDVNSGKVFGECTDNHRVETLIQIFKKHVASLPNQAVIHYICDNLSNHSCHEFCQVVAELSSVEYPIEELETKRQRQEWLQTENKRIIIHFTPKHGSWLNMVEIWFGIMSQKCLKHNSFKSVEELSEFLSDFIETWNQHFAHPFNWTYDGKGLHGKAVRRLITHISIENQHMELSFFSGQIKLMLNLLNGYFEQVDIKDWCLLADTMEEKKDYLEEIIQNSDKPRVKKKAEELYPLLLEKLKNRLLSEERCAA
jgi:transposase